MMCASVAKTNAQPDILAPGHSILTAKADPKKFGECNGRSDPDMKESEAGGHGVRYATGTSMAAPVLSGTAASLRQYFAEGYCSSSSSSFFLNDGTMGRDEKVGRCC